MIPNPLDIPASVDCVALASTGVDATLPLMIGLIAVAIGVGAFVISRGRMRRGGVALGLVLLLAAGGGGLAVAGPATSASADSCTPLDYSLDAELLSDASISSGDDVTVAFEITNVVDRKGTPPVVVSIPRLEIASAPVLVEGLKWTLDATTSAADYLFTYSGPLPKGTISSTAVFTFALSTADADLVDYEFPVSIVKGSGGDTNTANNSALIAVEVDGTLDYSLSGSIFPVTSETEPVPSGSALQIDLTVVNTVPRDGRSPILVRIPEQTGITNMTLSAASTGWTLVHNSPFYDLTYTPVIVSGGSSVPATLVFVASNGNSSTVDKTLVPFIASGSGGDSDDSNNSETLPLWVGGTVG